MTVNRVIGPVHMRVIFLRKGAERFAVFYEGNELGRARALRQLGKWAANPELSLSWFDAAFLSRKVQASV